MADEGKVAIHRRVQKARAQGHAEAAAVTSTVFMKIQPGPATRGESGPLRRSRSGSERPGYRPVASALGWSGAQSQRSAHLAWLACEHPRWGHQNAASPQCLCARIIIHVASVRPRLRTLSQRPGTGVLLASSSQWNSPCRGCQVRCCCQFRSSPNRIKPCQSHVPVVRRRLRRLPPSAHERRL